MNQANETRILSRTLKPSQRNAVHHIVRYYKDRVAYSGCTSVRIELTRPYSLPAVTLRTFRSDCGKNSPRQIMTELYAHFSIGPRGGITVHTARNGLTMNDAAHVKKMLRAK